MADWWKPDPETRRALRGGKEALALARYRSTPWMPAEEFDRLDKGGQDADDDLTSRRTVVAD